MIILALLEIPEDAACDLACQVASEQVPYRQRVRTVTERVLRERPDAVTVRWARLARQDREQLERRLAPTRGSETGPPARFGSQTITAWRY